MEAPGDIRLWSADDCLRYLTRFATELIGNVILGEAAFRRYLDGRRQPPPGLQRSGRALEYVNRAREVLELGDPGSSAGGEQPKFSATVGRKRAAVLVKFSPAAGDPLARRRADLLVCEHLALEAIARAGRPAARSELIEGGGQVFLEVRRFDRTPGGGRRGLISLLALDSEFVGLGRDWLAIGERLLAGGRIDAPTLEAIRWLETFGRLIANTDMHPANLSLFRSPPKALRLAPAYDMLPMLYAPQNEQLVDREFNAPSPGPSDAPAWSSACEAAAAFWDAASADPRISRRFRALIAENGRKVRAVAGLGRLLP